MSSKNLSVAAGPEIVSNYSVDITVLHEAARCVGSATDSKESVNKMLRLMSEMLGLNRGRVLLKDEDDWRSSDQIQLRIDGRSGGKRSLQARRGYYRASHGYQTGCCDPERG